MLTVFIGVDRESAVEIGELDGNILQQLIDDSTTLHAVDPPVVERDRMAQLLWNWWAWLWQERLALIDVTPDRAKHKTYFVRKDRLPARDEVPGRFARIPEVCWQYLNDNAAVTFKGCREAGNIAPNSDSESVRRRGLLGDIDPDE